jgi:hypothetical protein
MVRAVLDDRKLQTRRIAVTKRSGIDFIGGGPKDGPDWNDPTCWGFEDANTAIWWALRGDEQCRQLPCPYGRPGDRLWVRETFYAYGRWETRFSEKKGRDEWHFIDLTQEMDRIYQFDDPTPAAVRHHRSNTAAWWRRPSIFMPRAACRTLLEVTATRVERLQAISETDAEAEGIDFLRHVPDVDETLDARGLFRCLWDGLNAAGGYGWDKNPFVWVIDFRREGRECSHS